MQKVIFLGADLHGKPSELAAKLVRDLSGGAKDYTILSIQNRKPFSPDKNKVIIPKVFGNNLLRKLIQGFLLPIYLIIMRINHNKLFSFWVAGGTYHYFLFGFLKLLRYRLSFTIISGYDKNYSLLKFCDRIICQSDKMKRYIQNIFPDKKVKVIYPWTDLKTFKPRKKEYDLLIPSVPYKINDFKDRGMDKIIEILQESRLKTVIIFRSREAYEYFKGLNLKNCKLINKILSDKELADIMGKAKIIPLLYYNNAPDMPLSGVEGMASGCAILCTENMGISELISKNKCGVTITSKNEVQFAVQKLLNSVLYNKNARITAERLFDNKRLVMFKDF